MPHLTRNSKKPKVSDALSRGKGEPGARDLIGGFKMEENTKMSTAGFIIGGIMKLLWYLFLATVGILIFITMVLWEASKPNKNNGY